MNIVKALCQTKLVLSMAEARRSLAIGGVTVNGEKAMVDTEVHKNDTIKIGKKQEAKL